MASGTGFADDILQALRKRHPRFHEAAYLFVLSALQNVIERLPDPRHVTGRELAEGVRDLALERYGPMARTVLEFWGVESTADLGEVVFALVDCGVLIRRDDDRIADFEDVFDFEEAFERNYPWGSGL
ncbi:MAG: Minf_1886 family protein [Gemmatimonadota bacterium]